MLDFKFEAVTKLLSDMRDEKKAIAEYPPSLYERFSFLNKFDEDDKVTLGKIAVNDNAERPIGALTGQLQRYGYLGLQHDGGIYQACVNVDFNCGHIALITGKNRVGRENSNAAMREFHMLPFELQQSLLKVSIKDAPKTRAAMEKSPLEQRKKKAMTEGACKGKENRF